MTGRYESITMNIHGEDDEEITPIVGVNSSQRGRKNIRDIKQLEDLKLETIMANRNEKERLMRIDSINEKFKKVFGGLEYMDELILDYDFENNTPLVKVNKVLVMKMKTHQKEGVKFMWNACYESLEQIKKSDGSGCIIAHCMGLGKTFQVVALVHTLLSHKEVGTHNVLICCPKNTLINWINEFQMWITPDLGHINIYNPTRFDNHSGRLGEVAKWHTKGGVCLINYELFRILLEDDIKNSKQFLPRQKQKFQEFLCNPGPDLIICDEGHILKNEDTKLSRIMNRMRTLRRIVLTGTPMQNNLKEYHCMIQFVKPNLLGTRNEFTNMFVNPILNGQYENSLFSDVQLMKERSHVLHKRLMGCVQRFDLTTLQAFLPEKHEYVISVAVTDVQIRMYRFYMTNYSAKADPDWKDASVALFADYQSLQRVWTHPYTLKIYGEKHKNDILLRGNKTKKKTKKRFRGDETESDGSSEGGVWSRYPLTWWVQFATIDDVEDARGSNKLVVLLNILKECEEANEKLLVFSGSLYSLKMIEHFLQKINQSEFEDPTLCNMTSTWEVELDYLVLTGQTSSEDRDRYCKIFNDVHNTRMRLFLISTKAGGMGINLTAANRAVLFDISWNPSHDIQSVFRIYRIGQTRSCFVYRFVASGTMEEKIYDRQVAKQSISFRVVDEKQIARHYTESELLGLYQFEPNKQQKVKKSNVEPKDPLLRKILREESGAIIGIHEHDSLLEHKQEEELPEVEKKDAWTAYNNVNDFENLPQLEKTMVEGLTSDSFSPPCLRMVLEKKYREASEEEINLMMKQLMPKVTIVLENPNFLEIMKREAILLHNARLRSRQTRGHKKGVKCWDMVYPKNTPGTSNCHPSDSDDSVILCYIGNRKGTRKPLKSWGARNGKQYGSPERDLD